MLKHGLPHAFILAILLMALSLSGCLGCSTPDSRQAYWIRDDIPEFGVGNHREYEIADLWGGIYMDNETNEVWLTVHGDHSVSQEDLESFAVNLFADQGWPPPRVDDAEQRVFCGDV